MTPADIPRLLSDPSPQDWRKVARILDKLWLNAQSSVCSETKDALGILGKGRLSLQQAIAQVRRCIASWPADARKCVPREPLDHWRRASADNPHGHDELLDLCLKIRHESATYGYYETYVCNDPALLWTTDGPWGCAGCQQVHLVRGFSGRARPVRSEAWLRIGEPGQGDLVGWLSVYLPPYGLLAIKLEVEIKMPEGRLSPSQRARRDELARAGAIYLSTKSVKCVVGQVASSLLRGRVCETMTTPTARSSTAA